MTEKEIRKLLITLVKELEETENEMIKNSIRDSINSLTKLLDEHCPFT